MADIQFRRLTRPEAERVNRELKDTPNVIGYTVGELLAQKEMFVATGDGYEEIR